MSLSNAPKDPSLFPKRVYLTGYMGAGKSTVGKLLAKTLGYSFIDTDHHIVETVGKSIPDIFAQNGEPFFRETELNTLRTLSQQQYAVISTGGGTLTRDEAWEIVQPSGCSIYLAAPVEILFERVIKKNKE